MKILIQDTGEIIINLDNYGSLYFEPLGIMNDDRNYSATFRLNCAMCISGKSLYYSKNPEEVIKNGVRAVINNMRYTLGNVENTIKENKIEWTNDG